MIKSSLPFSSSFFLNKQKQILLLIKPPTPNRRLLNKNNYYRNKPTSFSICCCSHSNKQTPLVEDPISAQDENKLIKEEEEKEGFRYEWRSEIGSPNTTNTIITPPLPSSKLGFLLAFFACTTCVAFTGFVIAAVPTLLAMGRAAISFSKLADTAREELPGTMAAIRLSGMEISDLTLELSDLSHEITKGVNGSAQVVQAAEAGIRQMGSRAHQQTMSMIEERANLPDLSLQPVVVGAAKKTSRAVGRARKTLMNMFSKGDGSPDVENADAIERLEI